MRAGSMVSENQNDFYVFCYEYYLVLWNTMDLKVTLSVKRLFLFSWIFYIEAGFGRGKNNFWKYFLLVFGDFQTFVGYIGYVPPEPGGMGGSQS